METTYRIHPAIGIARLGNSTRPDGWFLGPEAPGQVPDGPFKDGPGSIKRQGARFRIYEYQDGKPVREIDNRVAQIIWKVHLVNSKAAGRVIIGGSELRNQHLQGADRARLILDSGAQPISSLDSGPVRLQGHFLGCCVPLGDLRTDGQGRLIVLGGFGHSFSPSGKELQGTFNNDDWCDDSADGPVTATIHFADRSVRAEPAWVVVGPPDYAAPVDNASSLYDVIYQAGYEQLKLHHDPLLAQNEVSFTRHVYPLLQRTVATYGVIGVSSGETGHEPQQNGNFLQPDLFARLKDNNPDPGKPPYQARDAVFGWLRDPAGGGGSMPKLAMSPSLEPWKYEVMKRWRDGKFAADWPGKPPSGHL
ncbi:MAG TPA: LodA/GoxA family CTQ-dependent oxidase, partial [Thermoanaerobaculia bacterium]